MDTFADMKAALLTGIGPKVGNVEMAPFTGWTWHDFRRSFATALGEAGLPKAVADAIVNQRQSATRGGVLGVSACELLARAGLRDGTLGAAAATAIEGRDADVNVVPMTARAA